MFWVYTACNGLDFLSIVIRYILSDVLLYSMDYRAEEAWYDNFRELIEIISRYLLYK